MDVGLLNRQPGLPAIYAKDRANSNQERLRQVLNRHRPPLAVPIGGTERVRKVEHSAGDESSDGESGEYGAFHSVYFNCPKR